MYRFAGLPNVWPGNPLNTVISGLEFLLHVPVTLLSLNISNVLNKRTNKFGAIGPNLLQNYQIYTGYIFKSANNRIEFESSVYYKFFKSDNRSS